MNTIELMLEAKEQALWAERGRWLTEKLCERPFAIALAVIGAVK